MIDQQVLIPYTGFDPTKEEVNINTFTIYTDPVAMYSSFKVFSTFYFGSYGHVNAISYMRRIKLLYQVNLYGTSKLNCLTNADLAQYPSLSISSLIPECVSDYLPYEDVNNECFDNDHFMDVVYKQTPPCELCDNQWQAYNNLIKLLMNYTPIGFEIIVGFFSLLDHLKKH